MDRNIREGVEWDEAREAALRRDVWSCQNCGDTVGKRHNPTVKEAQIHHKTPVSEGGSNDLSNLITLCADCHKKQHQKNSTAKSRYRATITDTDRENIAEQDEPTQRETDQSVYRVRQRITKELPKDIAIMLKHRPDVFEELWGVVCEGVQQSDDELTETLFKRLSREVEEPITAGETVYEGGDAHVLTDSDE